MGSYKLLIATVTVIDTIWWPDVAACQLKLDLIKSPTTLNHNGLLQAVDCDIHSDRYDMVAGCSCLSTQIQIGPHQVTYDAVAWPIHRVAACHCQLKLDLIRSPTTLLHGRYTYKELEQWQISYYTIVTNHNGSLQAVDCDIHSDRYDMVAGCSRLSTQIGLHQVTYDAVAWPIHI
eukprot:scaffold4450_cov207-Skeletonema_marinoi.AAC.2